MTRGQLWYTYVYTVHPLLTPSRRDDLHTSRPAADVKSRPLWPALIGHRVPRGQTTANRHIRSAMINITLWRPFIFTQFVLFFKDCDFSSGISNLRHTYGPPNIRLKMNTFSFKQIDGVLAKFLRLIMNPLALL